MRFRKEIELPGSLEEARAVLDDPDFRDEVARAAGADEVDVLVEEYDDGSVVSTVDTVQSTSQMPGLAQKFLGSELRIHQVENWETLDSASLLVEIPGQPGQVIGTITLIEGDVTVQRVEADITARIPLLGGKVEKLIGQILGHVLKIQAATAADHLGLTRPGARMEE